MRRTLPLILALVLIALTASPAAAGEEVFVLDNGMVLRGYEVRNDADGLVVRLSDFAGDARVTVAASRIVRRYGVRDGVLGPSVAPAMRFATDGVAPVQPLPLEGLPAARPYVQVPVAVAPLEHADAPRTTLGERAERLLDLARPRTPGGVALAALGLWALLFGLVWVGERLLEFTGLKWRKALVLSGVLAAGATALLLVPSSTLGPDRAWWMPPTLALVCLLLSWRVLRCGLKPAVLLTGFLGFCLSTAGFAAVAVLRLG
jgi:hypothetical protein